MAKQKSTNPYEAMFLLPPSATTDVEGSINLLKAMIERHQGEIMVIKKWDERKLAYEVKRQKRGLYVIAYFNAPGAAVASIERDVSLSEDILRVLITAADHLNKEEMAAVEPQPIIPREERSWDRPPMGDDFNRRPRFERSDQPAGAGKD